MTDTNIYQTQSNRTMSNETNKKQESQEFIETVNRLTMCVEIRQSYLNINKISPTEESLRKADSYLNRIEGLKKALRMLHEYGTSRNYLTQMFGVEL